IPRRGTAHKAALPTIEGTVPSLLAPPPGCRFAARCQHRASLPAEHRRRCDEVDPALTGDGTGWVACHFPLGVAAS
ncbi:MAG TPA: hypothetical protein PLN55_13105, partial [Burkholderiaceae bacterium]|nr:hypothetical protein [Burkholderiaceae bacterium]